MYECCSFINFKFVHEQIHSDGIECVKRKQIYHTSTCTLKLHTRKRVLSIGAT